MLPTIQLIILFLSSSLSNSPHGCTNHPKAERPVPATIQLQQDQQSNTEQLSFAKENKIFWQAGQKLRWNDFQARAEAKGHLDAYSTLGMSYAVIHNTETVIEMAVYGYFEKDKSWVKTNEETSYLLNHEQSHFDLCELYRRILKKRLAAFKNFTYANVNYEMKRIFNEVFDEYDQAQQRYDRETNHSLIKLKQAQWDKHIQKQITDHQAFAGDFVTLGIRVK